MHFCASAEPTRIVPANGLRAFARLARARDHRADDLRSELHALLDAEQHLERRVHLQERVARHPARDVLLGEVRQTAGAVERLFAQGAI